MKVPKPLIFALLLALLGSFVLLQVLAARQSSPVQVSSNAQSGTGLGTFLTFAERMYPGAVQLKRSALFSSQDLKNTGALFILSPEMELSGREIAIIQEFVESGGLLLASFHHESSWKALQPLLRSLKISVGIEPFEDFENYVPSRVSAPPGVPLFEEDRHYSMYSAWEFDSRSCRAGNFWCFVTSAHVGEGDVLLVSGLPPLANGLLGTEGNQHFAAHVLSAVGTLTIDEYRHFFSDKTVKDLLSTPSFILPILALLGGALVFFMFGYAEGSSTAAARPSQEAPAVFHDFSLSVLRGLVPGPAGMRGALALQGAVLKRRFPLATARIAKILEDPGHLSLTQQADALLALHKELMNERRGLRPLSERQKSGQTV